VVGRAAGQVGGALHTKGVLQPSQAYLLKDLRVAGMIDKEAFFELC